jgi:hypothetical protein
MLGFKIEPALIPGHNFAKIILLQSLRHWQKFTTFSRFCGLQLALQPVWDPPNVEVFHPQGVV